jgi:flagellar L-ring protein precursor FlgH
VTTIRTVAVVAALGLAPAALRAQAPQPAAAAPARPAQPAAPAAWTPTPAANRPGMASWVSDRRTFAVGDIVTVLVDDYTISSAIKDDLAQQRRTRDLGASVDVNSGTKPTSIDARIGTRNDGNTQQRGEARRENRFQSEMSVRIVAAGPNDTYQVKGARLVDVDKGKQNVTLTGWVRAQDVSANNTVESARLADAQLAYQSPGPLGKTKSGLLTRVVGLIWP